MNTPPTMNPASLPMAPIKSGKNKLLNKLDIKPKKLLYNDPEIEIDSIIDESAEIEEKLKTFEMKSTDNTNEFTKHVEQNELDNEAEGTKIERSYNLRRRNKNSAAQNQKKELKKKVVQQKIVDKENVKLENPSTSVFSSKGLPLSQPDAELNMREKVLWLQKRRDIGLWIECCNKNCKKWRFVEEYHDPVHVPRLWFCSMNTDKKFSSCDIPQDPNYYKCEEDLINNKFNAGSLVWAKINTYPWWPGIVDDCPETLKFYELKGSSSTPKKYHVTFFEENVSRTWLPESRIKPLQANDAIQPTKRPQLTYKKINYAKEVKKYMELAKEALPMPITERLKKYSFVSRYTGKIINRSPNKEVVKSSKKKKSTKRSKISQLIPKNNTSKVLTSKLESELNLLKSPDSHDLSEPPLDSCSNSHFPNFMKFQLAKNSKTDTQYSSESPSAINSMSSFSNFLKPNLPSNSMPIIYESSESSLDEKNYKVSSNIFSTPKLDSNISSKQTLVSLISTPMKKTQLPVLEATSQVSFNSTSSFEETGFEPSLPTSSATDSDFHVFSQSKKGSLETDKISIEDDDGDNQCSCSFDGPEGEEMNRLFNELIDNYDNFDPDRLDEIDIDELKKRYNVEDEFAELSDDDDEDDKWFYIFQTDPESDADSSDSDVACSRKSNKSPVVMLTKIEKFDEYLGEVLKEWDKVRVKPPSPTPEEKALLKKFLFIR